MREEIFGRHRDVKLLMPVCMADRKLRNTSQAVIDSILANAGSVGGTCAPQPGCVYAIQDVRKRNLGGFKQSGIDLGVNYDTATDFGSIDASARILRS